MLVRTASSGLILSSSRFSASSLSLSILMPAVAESYWSVRLNLEAALLLTISSEIRASFRSLAKVDKGLQSRSVSTLWPSAKATSNSSYPRLAPRPSDLPYLALCYLYLIAGVSPAKLLLPLSFLDLTGLPWIRLFEPISNTLSSLF